MEAKGTASDRACCDTVASFLAFDVIASFSFGEPFGFVKKGEDPYGLIETIDTRGEVVNALGSLPPSVRPLMKYHPLDSFWTSGLKARASLETFGRDAYRKRKASTDGRKDLLSYLFSATDPETKLPLQEEEIVAEAISFIVGGSDTTSSTMTNFIDFVSRDPDLQSRLQQEIDASFPGQPADDWIPSEKEAGSVPLLLAILREVMRVRPTSATGLERVTPDQGRVVAGKFIPPNVSSMRADCFETGAAGASLTLREDHRQRSNDRSHDGPADIRLARGIQAGAVARAGCEQAPGPLLPVLHRTEGLHREKVGSDQPVM